MSLLSVISNLGNKRFDLLESFSVRFHKPGFDFNINVARVIFGTLLLWKLLSRNFEFYGYVPSEIFDFYPVDVYSKSSYVFWTGLPFITDVLTFHWIHWFIDRPGPHMLEIIQNISIFFVLVFTVYGKGPRNIFVWITYVLLIYLWGHLFILGQEVDAIAMYFGLIIMLGISNYKDVPVWKFSKIFSEKENEQAGISISLMYLVFVAYYFASGLRKITDITFYEWFIYDLIPVMEKQSIVATITSTSTPQIFEYIFWLGNYGNILPMFVYLSHLIVPIVFFKREYVVKFFLFYAVFHFMAFGVSISFSGYVLLWGVLFHYKEWIKMYFSRGY